MKFYKISEMRIYKMNITVRGISIRELQIALSNYMNLKLQN